MLAQRLRRWASIGPVLGLNGHGHSGCGLAPDSFYHTALVNGSADFIRVCQHAGRWIFIILGLPADSGTAYRRWSGCILLSVHNLLFIMNYEIVQALRHYQYKKSLCDKVLLIH